MKAVKFKDPDSRVDYKFDWSHHFVDSDTIISAEMIVPNGLVASDTTNTNKTVTTWLSGGELGAVYDVTCRVTTTYGRIEDCSFLLKIKSL